MIVDKVFSAQAEDLSEFNLRSHVKVHNFTSDFHMHIMVHTPPHTYSTNTCNRNNIKIVYNLIYMIWFINELKLTMRENTNSPNNFLFKITIIKGHGEGPLAKASSAATSHICELWAQFRDSNFNENNGEWLRRRLRQPWTSTCTHRQKWTCTPQTHTYKKEETITKLESYW